ncbi:serine kinase of the HPr protein, regulates carbohydrate metabolism [Phenylobacterium zucineum HLK1]|uniref:Serine kinase of the HPr protein, regulates carbohydrate metabolism n=1 Tax=Phenylobacterium zucineum (strain HLK1) TaxID=450851 RepID=B4RBN9_PHEZH|nr:HPr kinase [Phenylobacterium zucineum]ACG76499.1 serine kinase of the HPr protein, regulates carbohydrate metabolism [Phenylobacterium zucineum HLK1]
MIRHAGLVAQRIGGRWLGVLIEGPSGAGKSDLALRCLGGGFRLVADDRVVLWASGGRLFGRAPDALHGLIEVRGLDVVRTEALPLAEVGLVARLGEPERIPDPAFEDILGVRTPMLTTAAFEESAPAKLSRALSCFDAAHNRRI